MNDHRILPFYMTYPIPTSYEEDNMVMQDLEYMQQLYPVMAKKFQKKIASFLDMLDFQGSLIYDEYPDYWSLYRLSRDILNILKQEAANDSTQNDFPPEYWELAGDMVQVILFYEIYKRRHRQKYGIYL